MHSLLKVLNARPDNSCSTCTACCDIIGVRELGKPYYARCVHLQGGCGIYADRPETCRAYRCIWHLGPLGDKIERRPDNLGVMFQIDHEPPFGNVLEVYELRKGAMNTTEAWSLVDKLLKNKRIQSLITGPVRIYPFGSDIQIQFAVSDVYQYTAPDGETVPLAGQNPQYLTFVGRRRGLLFPK
jgi:hypothetical protein